MLSATRSAGPAEAREIRVLLSGCCTLAPMPVSRIAQPITRAEMEQVRGVAVDGVLQTLVERGLVEQVGVAEVIGRPKTFGTTPIFLEYFGLKNLEEMPAADELRRIPIAKPEALLTVDPGLATAPPEQLASAPAETAVGSETTAGEEKNQIR